MLSVLLSGMPTHAIRFASSRYKGVARGAILFCPKHLSHIPLNNDFTKSFASENDKLPGRIELPTFCVLSKRDNPYTMEADDDEVTVRTMYCC